MFSIQRKKYARPSLWIIDCAQCNQKLSLGLDLYFIKLLGLTKIHLHCRKTNVILDCTEGSLVDIVKKLSRELEKESNKDIISLKKYQSNHMFKKYLVC